MPNDESKIESKLEPVKWKTTSRKPMDSKNQMDPSEERDERKRSRQHNCFRRFNVNRKEYG